MREEDNIANTYKHAEEWARQSAGEPRHTPGPLFTLAATKPSDGGIDHAVMATINGAFYCIGEAFEVVDHGVRMPAEANARLWAAAPDMLDALQGLSGLCQLLLARSDLPQDVREVLTCNHRVQAAHEAVARAEGRA